VVEKLRHKVSYFKVCARIAEQFFVRLRLQFWIILDLFADKMNLSSSPIWRKGTVLAYVIVEIKPLLFLQYVFNQLQNLWFYLFSNAPKTYHWLVNLVDLVSLVGKGILCLFLIAYLQVESVFLKKAVVSVHVSAEELAGAVNVLIVIPGFAAAWALIGVVVVFRLA